MKCQVSELCSAQKLQTTVNRTSRSTRFGSDVSAITAKSAKRTADPIKVSVLTTASSSKFSPSVQTSRANSHVTRAVSVDEEVLASDQAHVISKVPYFGGELEIIRLGSANGDETVSYPSVANSSEERVLRVWTPPGFSKDAAAAYPVVYLNDGQNIFESGESFSGTSWRAGEICSRMIASGEVPPFVLVAIDHAGEFRSLDFLPSAPGTGPDDIFPMSANWPGGGVDFYVDRVVQEIMPFCAARYNCASVGPEVTFGGSSFGAIAALYAGMKYPSVFGNLLVESPAFWAGDGAVLEAVKANKEWPSRMFVGFGKQEYSVTRGSDDTSIDEKLVEYTEDFVSTLRSQGMDESQLMYVLEDGIHNEMDWARRLPQHLKFFLNSQSQIADVLPQVEEVVVEEKVVEEEEVVAAETPTEAESTTTPAAPVAEVQDTTTPTEPVELLSSVQEAIAEASVQEEETDEVPWNGEEPDNFGNNVKDATFCCRPYPMNPGVKSKIYLNLKKSPLPEHGDVKIVAGFNSWAVGNFEATLTRDAVDFPTYGDGNWVGLTIDVPKDAAQMNFCFGHEGEDIWDNNDGENFIINVEDPAIRAPIPQEAQDKLDEEARKVFDAHHDKLYYHYPEKLEPGKPGAVYFNKYASQTLDHGQDVNFFGGFNSWSLGNIDGKMEQAQGFNDGWMTFKFNVPEKAFDFSLAFSNMEQTIFDNNDDNDYIGSVAAIMKRPPRTIKDIESYEHAGGLMEIVRLDARPGASRRSKWKEERTIRVWTPPGYSAEHWKNHEHGIPVLFMNDGKNLYEDWLAHQGVSWNAGHCAAGLIESGALPPFMIVGIDSPGPFRSQCYLPWPPGEGKWGHRPDAARWPGGDAQPYMERITQELIPLIEEHWGGTSNPELRTFGGASFGGVCSMFAAMHFSEYFGSFLVESPSLWSQEGRFLGEMWKHNGPWGERMFVGVGTKEHSYNHDEWQEIDHLILGYAQEMVRILEEKGVQQHEGRLAFQVDEGAGHVEGAWGFRLGGSLQFLCKHWWQYYS